MNLKASINKLLLLFNKNEKKKFLFLFFMMIAAALFETVGVGLIIPLVSIVTNPNIIHEQPVLLSLYDFFQFKSTIAFLIFSIIILLLVFILKNIYILIFQYVQNKIILNQQVKYSSLLFKEYLTKPFIFHLQRNSSDLLRNVNGEIPKLFQGVIMSSFLLLTEVLVISCILVLLIITSPLATITAFVLLGSSIIIFFRVFRKKISSIGKEQQKVGGAMIRWVNQGLGASKEVKVSGKEDFFINSYTGYSQTQANNNLYMKMLEQIPRFFIETLLVTIVLVTMLIIVLEGKDTTDIVSIMALFSMAAFRLMPSINRVIAMVTNIKLSQPALSVIFEDLFLNKEELLVNDKRSQFSLIEEKGGKTFNDSIELTHVSFRYPNQQDFSIKDVSLTIPIGKSVAFIGESGAGKTTIVDLILGLFSPEKGDILVDGYSLNDLKSVWQKKIGYIPQTIFLSDDTVRNNVAFGIPSDRINDEAVWKALEQAQLKELIEQFPEKLETKVGERGIRLSGGQRQRIGIARALYHNPEILFMDEATSALDNSTEKEIMKAFNNLKGEKTLIIIAHRLSTIENCDVVFTMNKGELVATNNKLKHAIS